VDFSGKVAALFGALGETRAPFYWGFQR